MTSDRMMQALGRIERAISRLETAVEKRRDQAGAQARETARLAAALRAAEAETASLLERERQRASAPPPQADPAPSDPPDPHAMNPFSHDKALAALRSLDSLIDDLQRARRDG